MVWFSSSLIPGVRRSTGVPTPWGEGFFSPADTLTQMNRSARRGDFADYRG